MRGMLLEESFAVQESCHGQHSTFASPHFYVGAQEAMRLYPAGGIASFRLSKTSKAVELNGGKLVLPPGVVLHMPITAIQRSAANWERPEEFLPERWEQVRLSGHASIRAA